MHITRRIDDLGRVVIPKALRQTLGWTEGTELNINLVDNGIFIKKYQPKKYFTAYIDENGSIIDADTEEVVK